jgi:hypothetical protein
MRWGHRKNTSYSPSIQAHPAPPGLTSDQKKAVSVGSAVIVAAILHKTGHLKPLLLTTSQQTLRGVAKVSTLAMNGVINTVGVTYEVLK